MPNDMLFNVFGRDVNASATLRRVGAEAETLGAKAKRSLAIIGVGAAIGLAEAVKKAGDYQAAVVRLQTAAGESRKNLKLVSDGMLSMAVATGQTTSDLASGMYKVESAGYHGAAGLKVLKAAAQGAKVEGADLNTVADALTTAMEDTHTPIAKVSTLMSQMVETVALGKMRMDDLAGSLHSVLPNATAAHIQFAQVAGALATMTRQGISADQASQNLNHMIVKLIAPTHGMTLAMSRYGLSSQDVAKNLGSRGLTGTLDLLTQSILRHMGPAGLTLVSAFNQSKSAAADMNVMLGKLPPTLQASAKQYLANKMGLKEFTATVKSYGGPAAAMGMEFIALQKQAQGFNDKLKSGDPAAQTFNAALKDMLGDQTSLQVALHLSGAHANEFNAAVAKIGHTTADAKGNVKDFAEISHTFNFQMAQLREVVETVAIKIGSVLIPALSGTVNFLKSNAAWVKPLAIGIASLWAAWKGYKIVTAAITAIRGAMIALQASSPILLGITAAVTALVGVGALAVHMWDSMHSQENQVRAATASLTKAIEDDGHAIGAHTRQVAAETLQRKGALSLAGKFNISLADTTNAYLRQPAAMKRVSDQLNNIIKAHTHYNVTARDSNGVAIAYTKSIDSQGKEAIKLSQDLQIGVLATQRAKQADAAATAAKNQIAQATGRVTSSVTGSANAMEHATRSAYGLAGGIRAVPSKTVHMNAAGNYASAGDRVAYLGYEVRSLPYSRTTTVTLDGYITPAARAAIAAIARYTGHAVAVAGGYANLRGYAQGVGYAPGGPTIVGEYGPEVLDLPRGSRVRTASQSAAMTGGGGDTYVTIVNQGVLPDEKAVQRAVTNALESGLNHGGRLTVPRNSVTFR